MQAKKPGPRLGPFNIRAPCFRGNGCARFSDGHSQMRCAQERWAFALTTV